MAKMNWDKQRIQNRANRARNSNESTEEWWLTSGGAKATKPATTRVQGKPNSSILVSLFASTLVLIRKLSSSVKKLLGRGDH